MTEDLVVGKDAQINLILAKLINEAVNARLNKNAEYWFLILDNIYSLYNGAFSHQEREHLRERLELIRCMLYEEYNEVGSLPPDIKFSYVYNELITLEPEFYKILYDQGLLTSMKRNIDTTINTR